ncbi:DUF502 domain-containing protein [Thiohalobacter sp. IOR34]|uniref:DUF502 domain-containing protein n=1 Tax=Thiohalobacter sp. IOR34 TaxID=3057176 RepID=UPI0025AF2C0A|nr:DUF502 domain-containing protein [Thiohalobacter sp. IOR34]WJW76090.1 DUF502 domain-containing protein [Thiohalobacter sp. IOR34]
MGQQTSGRFIGRLNRYLLAGIFTAIPIWVTWLIIEFFVRQLSSLGRPWVQGVARVVEPLWPTLARWLLEPWFQSTLAVFFTLLSLSLLGWVATRVIGRKLIGLFDAVIERIPFVHKVYGATKQLISVIQQKPEGTHRVVLIEFPSAEMKAVGFVMRTLTDEVTGEELAAVYVPTTPNPTSGYLEIVPMERLVATDWSMDEAMTFIISGGAVAPSHFRYRQSDSGGE